MGVEDVVLGDETNFPADFGGELSVVEGDLAGKFAAGETASDGR